MTDDTERPEGWIEPTVAEVPEPEPEPDEPEPAPEPEPEPQPEPVGLTGAEAEQRFAKAAKAATAYEKKLNDVLGELADDLTPCPLCPDVHRGFVNINDAGRIPDEVAAVVRMFLGDTAEADYKPSPTHHVCEACDGLGKVRTGSKVPNYDVLACAQCKGAGFLPPPGGTANGTAPHTPEFAPVTPDGYEAPKADTDPWGSPRLLDNGLENPNYGKMPQFKSATLP